MFYLCGTEEADLAKFLEKHVECRKDIEQCAGYTYGHSVTFTPGNIGPSVRVTCTKCSESEDITDVGTW